MTAQGDGRGALVLVPTPLDFGCTPQGDVQALLPPATLQRAATLTHWIVENARSARAFLKRVQAVQPLAAPLQSLSLTELPRAWHKQGDASAQAEVAARALLQPALQGHDVGLLSEAGMPAIADPGSALVRAAHQLGLRVEPLVGPVSLLLALAASGCPAQAFAFAGYLPAAAPERAQALRALEATARRQRQTQLFIETPYRNAALLQTALQVLQPDTRLAVACALTLPQQAVHAARVADWRRGAPALPLELPAVFVLSAPLG
ncbi:MAG: SAM-dependent methyltransferase [Tepidimonas sp.]|uniref:SAM-dependent methyltransferase n=1 Tax=Tepidimonas sp. TaxID=2002775 RepID=UPI00298F3811|nr:SAM-dependent methyltransferase [Tepidimonas sp.]MDW8335710.1 SAM-dependent methyltransferase [Tepidimonas sp.]